MTTVVFVYKCGSKLRRVGMREMEAKELKIYFQVKPL